jgi:hypothetical protein
MDVVAVWNHPKDQPGEISAVPSRQQLHLGEVLSRWKCALVEVAQLLFSKNPRQDLCSSVWMFCSAPTSC